MNSSPRAYVLMTAMPPTKGHLHLIQYAASLGTFAEVIVCTQPDEPYAWQRVEAVQRAARGLDNVHVHHIHKTLPQEPEQAVGFWDMWADFLTMCGLQPGDYIVASEEYGMKLAEVTGAVFMPYDIGRLIDGSRAMAIRRDPKKNFEHIMPDFQPHLIQRVTVFGAESVGKTSLSNALANTMNGHWLPEWARPYLEAVGPEITTESMTRIWKGQRALQKSADYLRDRPYVFQDTDLLSTVGYWSMYKEQLGRVPQELINDAVRMQSDLYVIPRSNIPFEPDQLRYGGDHRESTDEYWIELCEAYGFDYVVLDKSEPWARLYEATDHIEAAFDFAAALAYQRIRKEDVATLVDGGAIPVE